jgi:8-amino-7-oxononanoate synthase
LSPARRAPFDHNDPQSLNQTLETIRGDYRRVLVVLEGVDGMEGDFPDLPRFVEIKRKHKVLLLVDDSHGLGTMGTNGRGLAEQFRTSPADVDIWTGSLANAIGSCGGYVAGGTELIEYLRFSMPAQVHGVALPPAHAAAAATAFGLLQESRDRVAACQARAAEFRSAARSAGLKTPSRDPSPIVPVLTGDFDVATALAKQLFERGINAPATVSLQGTSHSAALRFFLTTLHTPEQIAGAVQAVAEELGNIHAPLERGPQGNRICVN